MKLFGLIVTSGTIGKDAISWTDEEVNGQPILMFDDSAPQNYEDITTIRRVFELWSQTDRDFWVAKDVAKEYFDTFGQTDTERFAALVTDEQDAACSFNLGPHQDMIDFLTIDIYTQRRHFFNEKMLETRKIRSVHALTEIDVRLPDDRGTFMADIITDDLYFKYLELGIQGTVEGDDEGLFDYILARNGTSYSASGLKLKLWSPIGTDMVLLSNKMIDILKNGIY